MSSSLPRSTGSQRARQPRGERRGGSPRREEWRPSDVTTLESLQTHLEDLDLADADKLRQRAAVWLVDWRTRFTEAVARFKDAKTIKDFVAVEAGAPMPFDTRGETEMAQLAVEIVRAKRSVEATDQIKDEEKIGLQAGLDGLRDILVRADQELWQNWQKYQSEIDQTELGKLSFETARFMQEWSRNDLGETRQRIAKAEPNRDTSGDKRELFPRVKEMTQAYLAHPAAAASLLRVMSLNVSNEQLRSVIEATNAMPEEERKAANEIRELVVRKRRNRDQLPTEDETRLNELLEKHRHSYYLLRNREIVNDDYTRLRGLSQQLEREYLRSPEQRKDEHLRELERFTLESATQNYTYQDPPETGKVLARSGDEFLDDTTRRNMDTDLSTVRNRILGMVRVYEERFGRAREWTEERKAAMRAIVRMVWPLLRIEVPGKPRPEEMKGRLRDQFAEAQEMVTAINARKGEEANVGFGVLKYSQSLDGRSVETLLDLAGIDAQVGVIPPGRVRRRAVVINSGNMEGIKYDRRLQSLIIDHHGDKSGADSSASEYFYEFLNELGFFDDAEGDRRLAARGTDKNTISEALAFVARDDNKTHPAWRDQKPGWREAESPRTVLGLASRLSFGELLRAYEYLKNKKGIIVPEERDVAHLDDADIEALGFGDYVRTQERTVTYARRLWDDLLEHGYTERRIDDGGSGSIFLIESPTHGRVIITDSGFQGGGDALRALAGPKHAYVIVNRKDKSLFVSSMSGVPEDLLPPIEVAGAEGKTHLEPRGQNVRGWGWVWGPSSDAPPLAPHEDAFANQQELRRDMNFDVSIEELCRGLGVRYRDFVAHLPLQDAVFEERVANGRLELPDDPAERAAKKVSTYGNVLRTQFGDGFALGALQRWVRRCYPDDLRQKRMAEILGDTMDEVLAQPGMRENLEQTIGGYLTMIEKGEITPDELLSQLRSMRDDGVPFNGKRVLRDGPYFHVLVKLIETDCVAMRAHRPELADRIGRELFERTLDKIATRPEISGADQATREDFARAVSNVLRNALIER